MRKTILLVLIGGTLLLVPKIINWVKYTKQSQTTDNPVVARVYNQSLYKSDLEQLGITSGNSEDSAPLVEKYIHSWVSRQLLIAEAEEHSEYNKAEIDNKIREYRNDLLIHAFLEKLVGAQINTEVSDEEIASYYKAHQKDFVLHSNFFRGRMVVVPQDAPDKAKLPSLVIGSTEQKLAALKRYCSQFASNYILDETIWLPWEELIKTTTLNNSSNKTSLLRTKKFLQTGNRTERYYFKISEYKLTGQISPLPLVRNQIADLIIHKRKIDLTNKIKEELLQRARKNNNCVIYEH